LIILDTNVVLEARRRVADERVLAWLDRQVAEDIWLTSITAAELQAGVERLPEDDPGRRSRQTEVAAILDDDFRDRVLAFDLSAALHYAALAGPLLRSNRTVRTMDLQIAGIARSHGAAVATRNLADFAGTGVPLINPWEA
jgi:toxin FitB